MANIHRPFGSQAQPIIISSPTQPWNEISRAADSIGSRETTPSQRESLYRLRPGVSTDFPSMEIPESPLFQHSQENTAHRATPSSTREEGNFSSSGTETSSSEDSVSFEELTRELKHKLLALKQKHQRRRPTLAKNAVIHLRQSVAFADEHQELHQSMDQLQKRLDISTTKHSKLLNEHRKLLLWRAQHEIKESHLRTRIANLCIQQQLFIERQPPECPICSDNKCDAETHCGHKFCWPCLITWYDLQKDQDREVSCPCCRALLAGKNHSARAMAGQLRWQ